MQETYWTVVRSGARFTAFLTPAGPLVLLLDAERSKRLARPQGSSTFAAGQVKRQVVPEGACSSWVSPPIVSSGSEVITVLPKPVRSGRDTDGPSCSIQLIVNMSPSTPQLTSIPPPSTDSAPYLVALVASSWSTRPMTSQAAALRRRLGGPCSAIRTPIRSAK